MFHFCYPHAQHFLKGVFGFVAVGETLVHLWASSHSLYQHSEHKASLALTVLAVNIPCC